MPDQTQFTPANASITSKYIILDGTVQTYNQQVANFHRYLPELRGGIDDSAACRERGPASSRRFKGDQLYLFQSYAAAAQKLQDEWNQLWTADGKIPAAVQKTKEISRECQDSINSAIRELNVTCEPVPSGQLVRK